MAFTTATRDEFLDGDLDTRATYASLHTADPGATGDNELSGGSYVRVPITWNPASGGSKSIVAPQTVQIPVGSDFTHFGMWDAVSGGTFAGSGLLDSAQSYPTGGTYLLNIVVNSA
jgi:hypothetical protein